MHQKIVIPDEPAGHDPESILMLKAF